VEIRNQPYPGEMMLQEKIKTAPGCPGVYLMKDRDGRVIYVGKAKNLHARVRSYFGGTDSRRMIPFLVSRIQDVEFIVTDTEKEALILENSLIKKHRPRYNINLRDDKNFYSIRIDTAEAFPRFELVRRVKKDGARYFGPYSSSTSVKETFLLSAPHISPPDMPGPGIQDEKETLHRVSDKEVSRPLLRPCCR